MSGFGFRNGKFRSTLPEAGHPGDCSAAPQGTLTPGITEAAVTCNIKRNVRVGGLGSNSGLGVRTRIRIGIVFTSCNNVLVGVARTAASVGQQAKVVANVKQTRAELGFDHLEGESG